VPTFLIGISGGEIIVIFLFILIFFGADKIPGFARGLGKTIRQVKDATGEIQRDIQRSAKEVKDEFKSTLDQPDQEEPRK
jgi:TatA/E family protein of Tat protein translocase